MIWDGPDDVDIEGEGGQIVTGIKNGDLVVIDAAGLGNDVELTISGAASGKSRFHVSCSDVSCLWPQSADDNTRAGVLRYACSREHR